MNESGATPVAGEARERAASEAGARDRRQSLWLALLGFGLLSIGDGVTKSITGLWPGSAAAAMRYSFGAIGLVVAVLITRGPAGFVMPRPWIQLGRGASVAFSTLCFFVAVQMLPLATVITVAFTTPMLTALLSAIFLRERAPPVVWAVSLAAFAGVLLALRPGFEGLGATALYPLGAALGMAGLMLFNRAAADSASPLVMQMLVAVIAAPILIAAAMLMHLSGDPVYQAGWPSWSVIARLALVACTATFAHWFIYLATIRASAALVAPTIYVQMLFAIAIGWFFFDDLPDASTLAGSALIIGAGLWLFRAERVRL